MSRYLQHPIFHGLSFLLLVPLAYGAFTAILSADIFWHLKIGQDFLFRGLNPWVDHYSIDWQGEAVRSFSLIFDCLAAIFYWIFNGELGLQSLRLFLLILPFSALFAMGLRLNVQPLEVFFALSLLVAGITFRKLVRPEMISYIIILPYVVMLWQRHFKTKYLVGLIPLQIFWQFSHSTAVFGFVFMGGIYLNYLWNSYQQQDHKKSLQIVLLGIGTLAVGFITPSGENLLFSFTQSDPRWFKWISELIPVPFSQLNWFYKYLLLWGFVFAGTCLWLRNWGAVLVLLVFSFGSLKVVKLFPHLSVLLAYSIVFMSYFLKEKQSEFQNKVINNISCLALGIFLFFAQTQSLFKEKFFPEVVVPAWRLPTDIMTKFKEKAKPGKIMNSYMMGGHLLQQLGPEFKVYIDGRTNILYSFDYFDNYIKSARDVGKFIELHNEKKFDYVIGYQTHHNRLVDVALESGLFGLDVVGTHNLSLVPIEKSLYPKLSRYFRFPQCFNESKVTEIAPEAQKVLDQQSPTSRFRNFYSVLAQFVTSKTKINYLQQMVKKGQYYPETYRFAAYNALRFKRYQLAIQLFQKAQEHLKARDRLILVELLCKYKKCQGAYPVFLKNVDVVMPNWRKKVLKKQYGILEKIIGPQFGSPGTLLQVKERLVFNDYEDSPMDRPHPCQVN